MRLLLANSVKAKAMIYCECWFVNGSFCRLLKNLLVARDGTRWNILRL
jgi:hypothetical protein